MFVYATKDIKNTTNMQFAWYKWQLKYKRARILMCAWGRKIMSQSIADKGITVLVVSDDAVLRSALCQGIEKEAALKLQGAFDGMQPVLPWLASRATDLLVVDLELPLGSGLDLIRFCAQRQPECNIMVLASSDDQGGVIDSIEAGASGYVMKDSDCLNIAHSLLELHAGVAPICPRIARKVLTRMRAEKGGQQQWQGNETPVFLTKRESAIIDLIACGDSYSEVARKLTMSIGTVQTHIKNIYEKLSVHSRGEAVYEASRRGLLQMDQLSRR